MIAYLNIPAIIVAAIAVFVLGALWYGPLFGKHWMRLAGFSSLSAEEQAKMKKKAIPGYVVTLIGALLTAGVLAYLFAVIPVTSITQGLHVALWLWLGFMAVKSVGMVLWEGKPWRLFYLNTTYDLASLLVIAVILSAWTV